MNDQRDKIWDEIRQLVLDSGPLPQEIDTRTHELEEQENCDFSEQREGLFAELIIARCAVIVSQSPGPMNGAPLHFILGAMAGQAMQREQEAMREVLGSMENFMNAMQDIQDLPTTDEEGEA